MRLNNRLLLFFGGVRVFAAVIMTEENCSGIDAVGISTINLVMDLTASNYRGSVSFLCVVICSLVGTE